MANRRAALAAAVLVLATVAGGGSPVAAASAAPVTGGSWYWAAQVSALPPVGGQNLGQPASAPTPDVPDGDFAVAAKGGQSDKETFLHIDTSVIPEGSTVSKFLLSLSEDAAAHALVPDQAKIRAVAVTSYFVDGAKGASYAERPSVDPTTAVDGTRGADGTWTFDLTPIATKWASGQLANNGVALVPVTDGGATFQAVWSGNDPPPTTSGEVTAPAGATGEATTPVGDTAGDLAGAGAGASPSGGSVGLEPDFASAPLVPGVPAPAPTNGAAGAPAGGGSRRPAIAKRASASGPDRSPPVAFYLGILGVLALAGAAMVALGEQGEPQLERRGSVLRLLERRRPGLTLVKEHT